MYNSNRKFWIAIAIIFILSFLASYALADEPVQIPVAEDFFIGQIVNVNVGHWITGMIVDYDGETGLYKVHTSYYYTGGHSTMTERKGSQLRARSTKRKLEVLPNNPPIQNIKAEVEEIKPEFKFKKGAVVISHHWGTPWGGSENVTTRITDRAVLWGENVYRVERSRRRPSGDNGPGIWYETISEKDLQLPEKEQPEYVEGLQP